MEKELNALTPKMWEDLTDSEKIERMRQEVKGIMSNHLRELLELKRIIQELKEHSHSDGKVV